MPLFKISCCEAINWDSLLQRRRKRGKEGRRRERGRRRGEGGEGEEEREREREGGRKGRQLCYALMDLVN